MDIKVETYSPPDYENLAVGIIIENRQFCEVNQEDGEIKWEFYPNKDNLPWVIDHQEFIVALKESLRRLDVINKTAIEITNFKD